MTFEEIPLRIPNLTIVEKKAKKFLEEFQKATSAKEQAKVIRKFDRYYFNIQTDLTVISIRYTLNTQDPEYQEAQAKADELIPEIESILNIPFAKAMLSSPYYEELKKIFGEHFMNIYRAKVESFDDRIVEDLQEENRLLTQYNRVVSAAKIPFRGEIYNLSQLAKFTEDLDRETRKEASKAYWKFFEEHNEELGKIYDDLVHVRTKMAHKLGYKNFVELGYLRLGRTDYGAEEVKKYRDQIYHDVVPVTKKLFRQQAKRLEIKNPKYYDYNLTFKDGNPTPIGNRDTLVLKAQKMYDEMSAETGPFFRFMCKHHLLDLDARAGKSGGGYMTYLSRYEFPFVFANFNGTQGDVEVLTHEIGHSYQGYCARKIFPQVLQSPTYEACEIHSMSMEFFAWPWMKDFFGDQEKKFLFAHLSNAVTFLPYGVAVDEFQHFVYENPDVTHQERLAKWREIEKKYLPHKEYRKGSFLDLGGFWMKQRHIFESPFYYIDYTLAQVVAFEFLIEMQKDYKKAWKKYNRLCNLGGKYPFTLLLKKAHLANPFIECTVKKIIRPIERKLKSIL